MVIVNALGLVSVALALVLAPLLQGVIHRTKAFFAGRQGAPVWQPYYDLARLLGKGAVYSRTTTWIFVAGPVVGLASLLVALTLMPLGGASAFLAFPGDLVLMLYLLGLLRFVTVLAALDTGSSFEGMGASREVTFAALAEPPVFLALAILARKTGALSLSGIMSGISPTLWVTAGPMLALLATALFFVFLAENARIPVDDPNTHLELTMIHEVMVLDHSGPDFAMILYGASLKLWLLGSLVVGLVLPAGLPWFLAWPAAVGGLLLLAVLTGVVESTMARLRLHKVPQFLVGALIMTLLALVLGAR
ncbi:MAG: Hydrogenase 4 subunit C [Candidatus Ozemobacter sibiricus]|jgi:formate hydrogenlyase subunit 4|uniref:Hydrogenase 4 subunit C n=1 Tax=Candidatus Ozemobacter sibiricus TaxID=2268124 RepID=A0A367ZN00_9BACT|nr:MAG: Hydrogenase 4 subunit C [Candidatus Ozemobacter sibiricus]